MFLTKIIYAREDASVCFRSGKSVTCVQVFSEEYGLLGKKKNISPCKYFILFVCFVFIRFVTSGSFSHPYSLFIVVQLISKTDKFNKSNLFIYLFILYLLLLGTKIHVTVHCRLLCMCMWQITWLVFCCQNEISSLYSFV